LNQLDQFTRKNKEMLVQLDSDSIYMNLSNLKKEGLWSF